MTGRRRQPAGRALVRAIAAVSCIGAVAWAGSGPASAADWPADPPANVQTGPLPAACYWNPVATACELPMIGYLDAARETLGFGPYDLPANFVGLAPERQLFILVNLDRLAYALPVISGLSPQLDAAAGEGAAVEHDPVAPAADRAVWASAWAAGLVNVLDVYYQLMYLDGYPGLNVDCGRPGAVGCWVHRHGILFGFQPSVRLTMGAAVATEQSGGPVVGMIIAATRHGTGPAEDYTWADAQADGAGRGPAAASKLVGPAGPRITGVKAGSGGRTATVYFTAGHTGGRFECALVRVAGRSPGSRHYAPCRSPASYARLRPGGYEFFVRGVTPASRRSAATERRIAIG